MINGFPWCVLDTQTLLLSSAKFVSLAESNNTCPMCRHELFSDIGDDTNQDEADDRDQLA